MLVLKDTVQNNTMTAPPNTTYCFLCRESDRQGVEETAQQTAKSPEEGAARRGEEECRERETAKEPEEEEGGR